MDAKTVVCPVKTEQVKDLMKDDAEFSFKIYKWLGWRMKKMERRIDNLIFKDVRARLIDFIKELAVEKGKREGTSVEIQHFFTHKNIANLIGTSRQTVTTTLNDLRDEGVLNFDRKHFYIKNINALG
jgi:CRP/FNR family cyclic AMP-dependent transcriptional regulator